MVIKYRIKGMTCPNCAHNIETYLQRKGVKKVHVDYDTGTLWVEDEIREDQLVKWVRELGYDVLSDSEKRREWNLVHSFLLSCLFTFPLILGMFIERLHDGWFQWLLATPVVMLGLKHFGKSALGAIRVRQANMDVLILLGSLTAYGYSCIEWWRGESDFYFETAASIITIIFLGNVLEQYALRYARRSYQGLEKLARQKVHCFRNGKWIEVEAEELQKGDRILLQEGIAIPVDGILLRGEVVVDESMVTGESVGIQKGVGAEMLSGTLVLKGSGEMEVRQPFSQSFMAQLIALSEKVEKKRPRVQQVADRVSAYFVPIVVAIALFTLTINVLVGQTFSEAIMRAIAVLVIACPCALGIATPTALLVGSGRAARRGILIRDADAFELLCRSRFVIFDKTGTLTKGSVEDIAIHFHSSFPHEQVKRWLKGLTLHSLHPLSVAIQRHLNDVEGTTFSEVEEIKGQGLKAQDEDGNLYRLGTRQFTQVGMEIPGNLFFTRNDTLLASLEIQEKPLAGSKALVHYLKKRGKEVILLSGDRCEAVKRIADELGIETYYCEQRPEQKLHRIEHYTKSGITVMVGDGLNDTPALAQAHVGIAITERNYLAAARAKIVVLTQDPGKLIDLFETAKITYRLTKQNLFWAFFYNVLAIPVAAAGFLHPILASFSMAFSDLVIVGNTLRYQLRK